MLITIFTTTTIKLHFFSVWWNLQKKVFTLMILLTPFSFSLFSHFFFHTSPISAFISRSSRYFINYTCCSTDHTAFLEIVDFQLRNVQNVHDKWESQGWKTFFLRFLWQIGWMVDLSLLEKLHNSQADRERRETYFMRALMMKSDH